MKSKILVLGFACLSLVALGQSNEKEKAAASAQVKAPRDTASGQASGKAASEQKGVVHRDLAARDAQTGQATGKTTGKTSAQDDWHQQRVAVGDVNGDGKADVTANGSAHASGNAVINTSHSNIKSPRDIATGQATGKRQHQPITIRKEVDAASPKN
jgi:hypothetical protein